MKRRQLRQGMSYLVPMASFYFISGITNTFQGYYRGIGHLMITLFATLVQIPIRVVISYALFGRLGIQAVAIGTTIGWACMVVFELLMYRGMDGWKRCGRTIGNIECSFLP